MILMEEARELEAKDSSKEDPVHAKVEALYQAASELRTQFARTGSDK